ncbi:MAG: pyridoxamine 5'-phosphate oxidase family protein [bacterium]|nr:pyridoxamine 5'-phosphate oxidase family protein [bacterium]
MSKKKYIIIVLLVLIIGIGVYLKITFPFLTVTFIKDSIFPPTTVVDARTRATLVIYTKELAMEEIIKLINAGPARRVLVIGTVNADGTPHAGVFAVSAKDGQIIIDGQSGSQTCKNIERSKKAIIEVYKKPDREARWFEHVGARIWVELEKNTVTGPLTNSYAMSITAHRAI